MRRNRGLKLTLIVTLALVAAGCDNDEQCQLGSERCDCTADGACDHGLSCVSGLCVRVAGGDAGDDAGDAGDDTGTGCPSGPENTVAACSDGCSNDGDQYIDCDDYDCCSVVECPSTSSCWGRNDAGSGCGDSTCPEACCSPSGRTCCRPPFCARDCVGSPCC